MARHSGVAGGGGGGGSTTLAGDTDVHILSPADQAPLVYDQATLKWVNGTPGGGGGAPTTAHYITTQAEGGLSAESVLGTDIILPLGTFAAIPAAGLAGRIYAASDTGRLYRDNGASWDQVGSLSTDLATKLAKASNLSDLANRQTALDNLAGAVTNTLVLAGDGTHVTLRALLAADIPAIPESGVTNLTTDLAAKASSTLAVGGDLTGNLPNPTLAAAGPGAVTKGSATKSAVVTTDAKGRVSTLTEATIAGAGIDTSAVHSGDAAGGDLTGTFPSPTLATAGPGATGPIGDATHTPVITIDAKGRVTGLSSAAISGGGGTADALGLTPTAVKTANYTAVVGDFIPCDTNTTGAFTVTLPTTPADGSVIAIKLIKQDNTGRAVTIATGGSDVINVASGATTSLLTRLNQGVVFQYKATGAIWYSVATDITALSPLTASKTANYTALTSDTVILCDATTTASFTVTLYAASGNRGRRLIIKKTDADYNPATSTKGIVTIDANASETIDGALTITLMSQYAAVELICDGVGWQIV